MNSRRRPLVLKCLTAAVAVALLAAPTLKAATGGGPATELRPMPAAQQVEPSQIQPSGSGKSYFWSDAAIAGGVLAGIVVLGLWGDVAISGAILGIQLFCVGWAMAVRTVGAYSRRASRRVWQAAGSNPAASSR
jgi:hypothetical protein